MCGIAGILNTGKGSLNLPQEIFDMARTLHHRGPDDEGYAFFSQDNFELAGGGQTPAAVYQANFTYTPKNNIDQIQNNYFLAFGHRRLSIIDPSPAGHQPMSYDNERYWLIFNGEIYNYRELKQTLIKAGLSFKTETDSEVLLAAYVYWGEKCLQHLNGMWAFVIYDRKENLLFGARDRFGVKPFYYYKDNGLFAFASEQKTLTKISPVKVTINERAAFEYLVLGRTESNEQGLFENILELLPAHFFTFDIGRAEFRKKEYYQLETSHSWEKFNSKKFQEYSYNIQELLREAVKKRLRADVPIGTCLSGGIDSSALVCIIDQLIKKEVYSQIGQRQKVFTACYENGPIDESAWASKVVEATKTSWHKIYPNAEGLLEEIEDLTYHQDIPILGTSTYAQYCVMKRVSAEGVRVTLDGQGADELFSGYAPHFVAWFYEALKHGSMNDVAAALSNPHPGFSNRSFLLLFPLKSLLNSITQPQASESFRNSKKEFKYLNREFWNRHTNDLASFQPDFVPDLNKVLKEQFTGRDLKVLLRTGDRNSMRFSVESRMPFSDDIPLIEYLFQIPSVYKIRDGQSKSLLRNAVSGIIPDSIKSRKDKLGFATPQFNWLGSIKNELKQYITSDLDQFIDSKAFERDLNILINSASPHSTHRIFRMIQFSIWKKTFNL